MSHKGQAGPSRLIRACGLVLLAYPWLAAVTGCAVGPDYKPPETQVPPNWTGPTPPVGPEEPAAAAEDLAHWWTRFQDPMLTSLVERALTSNLNLKQAEARIRQAQAARGIAFSGLGPTADLTGSFRRSRSPGGPAALTSNNYQTGLEATWNLDVIGGARRNVEAADADLQAAVEARRDLQVALAAEVALNYIDVRAFEQRVTIARENLTTQQHSAELVRTRFRTGFVGALDVANAEAQVATTASQIATLEASARQAIYNLSVLLGQEPAALVEELSPARAIPAAPPPMPLGVPSDLLRRRPDVRQAEAQIHASTARIGVAEADLFPQVTISGSAGFQGTRASSWLDWANRFWAFGPTVSWQLFTTGRVLSNIALAQALEEQSLLTYRQTVLTALQQVENALVAGAKEEERRQALADAVAANRKAVALATQLYTQGQTDFLNVLQAQGALYVTEDALVQSTSAVSTNLVTLYQALGGGWDEEPSAGSPPPAVSTQRREDPEKKD